MSAEPPPRRGPLQPVVYWACWSFTMIVLTLFFRLRRFHSDRLPLTGPCLVVANHQSHLDPPLVAMCATRRQMHFVARIGLFKFKPFGWLIAELNSVPIREDSGGDVGAIREVLTRLGQGRMVLLFPEGSRSPDGAMHEFKGGVALLLKRAQCPVVPVAVEGCYDAFPRHSRFPRLLGQRIAVMVGEPIPPEELLTEGPREALERLRREIDSMRQVLRSRLRASTKGRLPAPGPADAGLRDADGLGAAVAQQPAV